MLYIYYTIYTITITILLYYYIPYYIYTILGMCVLQDFEALTPNLLARTIETVEGGGLIIILLKTVKSLSQLYTLTMDIHTRYRTEAHHEIIPRFNERFILSLSECKSCIVLDDELNILPISSKMDHIPTGTSFGGDSSGGGSERGSAGEWGYEASEEAGSSLLEGGGYLEDPDLIDLKASLADTPNIGKHTYT